MLSSLEDGMLKPVLKIHITFKSCEVFGAYLRKNGGREAQDFVPYYVWAAPGEKQHALLVI